MKNLLSMLAIFTLISTSIPKNVLSNCFLTKLENNNFNLNAKNLEAKEWGKNVNLLEVWYKFLQHDEIILYISHNSWQNVIFHYDNYTQVEFDNFLYGFLNSFLQRNHSASGNWDKIDSSDINIMKNVIINHYDEINFVFARKKDDSRGLGIKTNRNSY